MDCAPATITTLSVMHNLLRILALALAMTTVTAFAERDLGDVVISADLKTISVHVSGSPAEIDGLANLAFNAHGRYRRVISGGAFDIKFTQVAAAQAAGTISAAHARIITHTIDALPAAVQAEQDESVETFLLDKAQDFDPTVLAQIAHRISDTLNPDGTEDTERDRARRRDLRISRRPDGSSYVHGELTAICTEALLSVLDTLAKPKPRD